MRDFSINEPILAGLKNYFSDLLKTSKQSRQSTGANAKIWDAASNVQHGNRLLDKGKPAEAFHYYEAAAAGGSASGQHMLAEVYYNFWKTLGFERDDAYKKAFDLYEQAAAQNHELALVCLGDMYDRGHGVEENQEMAQKCWKRAKNDAYLSEFDV